MTLRVVAVVLAIIGLYLALWHGGFRQGQTELLPLTHFAVGLGSNHTVHSIVGLVFLGAAAWLWFKKAQTTPKA